MHSPARRGALYSFLLGIALTLLFYYTFVPSGTAAPSTLPAPVHIDASLFAAPPPSAVLGAPSAASLTSPLSPAPPAAQLAAPSSSPAAAAAALGAVDGDGVSYTLGGLRGPGVSQAWVPHRTLAHLDLGVGGAQAAILVDNWFGYHHSGVEALAWSASAQSLSLLGEAKPWAGSPPGLRAPPLPQCPPLSPTGRLVLPPDLNVQAFPDYPSADLIRRGRDSGAFVPSMGAAAGAGASDSPSFVRALPWHRLWHNESSDFPAALSGSHMLYASMTPHSRARFCATGGGGLNPDFAPSVLCDGTPNPAGPSTRYPYCNRATAPVAVMSLDCAFVDSIQHVGVIVWNVLTLDGGGAVVTYNGHPRWELRGDVPVTLYEELACAGTSVYPEAPGHLFNEILPRLIHLDSVLPVHIPLLWPPGALPGRLLADLQAAGLVSSERTFVPQPAVPSLFRARRLYVYTSDYGSGHTPLILYTSQRVFAARLHARSAALAAAGGSGSTGGKRIIVLQRAPGQPRAIGNHEALMEALRAAFPGHTVDTFLPGSPGYSFVEVAAMVYDARVVIGPHGANMNNIVGMREGCWVVEVGYSDSGESMPSDYFCQARNLGLRYWLAMADSGSYGGGIVANIPDILDIVKQAFQ